MTSVAHRLRLVRQRIERVQPADGQAVTLVAVSKRKPADAIVEAIEAGCQDFGENYVQELQNKALDLSPRPVRWHFIGHLQRNKAKQLLTTPQLALLHGVDSPKLVAALSRHAAPVVDVLVQVDVSGEESKSGCPADALGALLDTADATSNVRVRGLMTMPPAGEPEQARPYFRKLRELRDAHGGRARLPELSMGMSHDFEVAIEEGATIVRVGSAIFGPRD